MTEISKSIIANSYIANSYIEIHRNVDPLWDQSQGHFATLFLEVADTPPTTTEQLIVFSTDISGSMSQMCSDNKSKMQHIINTTKNIIDVFSNTPNTNISVEVYGFDDRLETIVERTKCVPETRSKIHNDLIEKLIPRGNTNMSIALYNAKNRLSAECQKKTHIFMTDGHITVGEKDFNTLASIIDPSYQNILIGFGEDHDAVLLNRLSKNGKYYYINEIESAGLAYGEITHSILYKAVEKVTISVNNGEIYDFQTNSWCEKLEIPYLLGEAKKTYHLRTINPDLLSAEINGYNTEPVYEHVDRLPELLGAEPTDLTKYIYRQRTLEILYEAQMRMKEVIDHRSNESTHDICKKMNDFLTNMKEYINQKDLNTDDFMSSLCDDIGSTIAMIKTSGIKYAISYSAGRAASNGTQAAYQPVYRCLGQDLSSLTDNYVPRMTSLNRANTGSRQMRIITDVSQGEDDNEDEFER